MKTLRQIIESAISTVSGGLFIDDRHISSEQIEYKADEGRALWCIDYYSKTGTIHPDWIQRFYPEYDSEMQESKCMTTFYCPHILAFMDGTDGLRYFGAKDGYADNFTRIQSRAQLAAMMNHNIMRIGRRNYVLYQNGIGEAYTKTKINDPMMEGVFARPTEIPTFNKEKSNYPLDPAGVDYFEKYLTQTVLKMEISTPSDSRSDGVDSNKLPRAVK